MTDSCDSMATEAKARITTLWLVDGQTQILYAKLLS